LADNGRMTMCACGHFLSSSNGNVYNNVAYMHRRGVAWQRSVANALEPKVGAFAGSRPASEGRRGSVVTQCLIGRRYASEMVNDTAEIYKYRPVDVLEIKTNVAYHRQRAVNEELKLISRRFLTGVNVASIIMWHG